MSSIRADLIKQRNFYVDKPFYLWRFWLHSKVAQIDAEIAAIDICDPLSIESLMKQREIHIINRNFVLDDPFIYHTPVWKRRLKEIDKKLDEIDAQIYLLEKLKVK